MTKKLCSEKEHLEKPKLNPNEPRDIKNILLLAKQLQDALPFGSEGITSEEEYANALAVADELTNDYDDSYAILLDVLWPPIERYESTRVKTI